MLFQSCFFPETELYHRAGQGCITVIHHCSVLLQIRHLLVGNSKKNTNLHYFSSSVHFCWKPYISAWGIWRVLQFEFLTKLLPERIFSIALALQNYVFFVILIPSHTFRKHLRRFSNSTWSSAEQRSFRGNQRWTALKQRWSALVFLNHSETALFSADFLSIQPMVAYIHSKFQKIHTYCPYWLTFWLIFYAYIFSNEWFLWAQPKIMKAACWKSWFRVWT